MHSTPSNCRDVIVWTGDTGQAAPTAAIVEATAQPLRTLGFVIREYQSDPLSGYHKLRFAVRRNHASLLRRMLARHGATPLAHITGRKLVQWHAEWQGDGKVSMAHAFIAQMRTLCGFGLTLLQDSQCERLCLVLGKLRFPMAPHRVDRLTFEQADAVRHWAHQIGWHSIALAQAFQFELMLRQKDVIGEWVPMAEPGASDMRWRGQKWLRGILWSEIDDDLILRHVTSKRQKPIVVDLKLAPMVMEELECLDEMPDDGPVLFCESTCMPYATPEFRRKWRIVANYAGIPANVRNMDSRSGAISEAFEAGISGEQIQKTATHSDIKMTQKYNRGDYLAASNTVANTRVASRRKPVRETDTRAAPWRPAASAEPASALDTKDRA